MCLMENINTESEKEGSREHCKWKNKKKLTDSLLSLHWLYFFLFSSRLFFVVFLSFSAVLLLCTMEMVVTAREQ